MKVTYTSKKDVPLYNCRLVQRCKTDIVAEGFVSYNDKKVFFFVVTNYAFPCAYVRDDKLTNTMPTEDDVHKYDVHGGITYYGPAKARPGIWLGWDYHHIGDYTSMYELVGEDFPTHKWTLDEIMEDILHMVEQL